MHVVYTPSALEGLGGRPVRSCQAGERRVSDGDLEVLGEV